MREFQDGVREFVRLYGDGSAGVKGVGVKARGFDLDSKVQVFETVIRGLGMFALRSVCLGTLMGRWVVERASFCCGRFAY